MGTLLHQAPRYEATNIYGRNWIDETVHDVKQERTDGRHHADARQPSGRRAGWLRRTGWASGQGGSRDAHSASYAAQAPSSGPADYDDEILFDAYQRGWVV